MPSKNKMKAVLRMQLDYLKYVLAVKEWGSLNKAAEHLYVSQQHISKIIAKLEEECGRSLFLRTARGMVLTDDGKKLCGYAQAYEAKRRQLEADITAKYLKDLRGSIRIGAMSTGSAMVLPQMLCRYYHDYPQITIDVVDGEAQQIVEWVLADKVDLAIILVSRIKGVDYPQIPQGLTKQVLVEAKLCYWVSSRSPLAKREDIAIEEAVTYPLVLQSRSDLAMLETIYQSFGRAPAISAVTENPYLLSQLTADDFGICPDIAIKGEQWMLRYVFENQQEVHCLPMRPTEQYVSQLCLISNKRQPSNLLRQHVIDFILNGRWRG